MRVEGLETGAQDGDFRPQVLEGCDEATEEWDHCHLTEGNPVDICFIDYGEQRERQVLGVPPGAGNEVDEGLNYLIFSGGGHSQKWRGLSEGQESM